MPSLAEPRNSGAPLPDSAPPLPSLPDSAARTETARGAPLVRDSAASSLSPSHSHPKQPVPCLARAARSGGREAECRASRARASGRERARESVLQVSLDEVEERITAIEDLVQVPS